MIIAARYLNTISGILFGSLFVVFIRLLFVQDLAGCTAFYRDTFKLQYKGSDANSASFLLEDGLYLILLSPSGAADLLGTEVNELKIERGPRGLLAAGVADVDAASAWHPPITLDRTLLFARLQRVRANQFPKAGSHSKERWELRLIRFGSSHPLLKALGNIYFDETHIIRLDILYKLIVSYVLF